ncbi:NUDIX domain-containing protein [Actinoplanes xinjiangensis]|jgi:8-oxo-dGTP pyrophosphatase MutT (NUDIX family)|uniref:ADP-ribose pyrophosphatase n=1 Tax=Actinoplanes xinjiangensis TaxID=512350 RepID=A0A316EIG3_9ACTN|nr:NUDIX hydrolase [Actinoplanes xinjiangensis]PWK30063.1 ADP-ribose pyrophosphatase [Actinoplanes xinjiangensis]GIF44663.1 ADP-ribose pyrophosphatase [Actinoplanes xinjiangensis]
MGFAHETVSRAERYHGAIFSVYTDQVTMSDGSTAARDVVENRGAVVVVALDEQDRVVLIKQYRHPVGRHLWELPAGLRDVVGEDETLTAARELAEEVDLTAGRIDRLIDLHTSPGFADESVRVFLARDLAPVPPADRHERTAEEADLEVRRVDLDECVAMVFRGEITNAAAVAGVLAAARARDTGWTVLPAA